MRKSLHSVAAFVGFCLVSSCAPPSEEARIRDFLKETAAQAEKGNLDALSARLAADYRDFEGRDRAGTRDYIGGYFERTRGIVIHLLSVRVDTLGLDGIASVRGEIMLSSGAAEVLRKLVRFAGEYYRIELRLRRTDPKRWEIVYAGWQAVPITDLFPESLNFLKKLFPGL